MLSGRYRKVELSGKLLSSVLICCGAAKKLSMYHTTFFGCLLLFFYNILVLQSKVHLTTMNPGETLLSQSQAISFLARKKKDEKKEKKLSHQELGAKVSYIILRTSPLVRHQVCWRLRVYCPVCMCVYACVWHPSERTFSENIVGLCAFLWMTAVNVVLRCRLYVVNAHYLMYSRWSPILFVWTFSM